jgi:dienelactone hydrolase
MTTEPLPVRLEPTGLHGLLRRPPNAKALVLFAHGSGSGRSSPRNNAVAAALGLSGLATLLFDLLTEAEAADRANVFDIALLGQRLCMAVDWARGEPGLATLQQGCFGASTGAAAALLAAAARPKAIRAVVSRGGRPDLAAAVLGKVRAPTLLIVGGRDEPVIELNRQALAELRCRKALEIVPGASHLFPEPGALDTVTVLARDWFLEHLADASGERQPGEEA